MNFLIILIYSFNSNYHCFNNIKGFLILNMDLLCHYYKDPILKVIIDGFIIVIINSFSRYCFVKQNLFFQVFFPQ